VLVRGWRGPTPAIADAMQGNDSASGS